MHAGYLRLQTHTHTQNMSYILARTRLDVALYVFCLIYHFIKISHQSTKYSIPAFPNSVPQLRTMQLRIFKILRRISMKHVVV